ncbi:3-oxoacyl-ACP synthase III family protein [Kroppenstedtia eburnea]|uniref:3-oxoacyl-[acyl-carrier-protein] synthase-3 n=1 Tax=Kroppenstedtia eburnea TaxID=714067 RepID=A0A1N7PWI3_9BACL|nr:ketoacyl-ACP synthase III [Kroppenstedtia eburnea]EGK09185.1 3-oxoacyl-[acyl-carrier-protein] synthase III [Desmospora sp. 8437]QKI80917.1 ketoacyl-ACP synthase III [Kroppenstedtia eburnea]SIT14910.1 3-oxoacyl-[acyl-carrier-protein] synthase-3 [Kroppenstedtia eburnea]
MGAELLNVERTVNTSGLSVPVGISGTGMYVPDQLVTNEDLVQNLDTSDEWIVTKTGIRERRFLREGELTSDMCVKAAEAAMADAGVTPGDLDAIIISTFTFDQLLPSTALIVRERLGADRAIPIDLNQAACAGSIYAIWTGCHLMQNQQIRCVLVIGAEALSRITDPEDRSTRVFFGDAAGAVVLNRTQSNYGILSWDLDAALSYSVEVPAGGAKSPTTADTVRQREHFLKMDGRKVWTEANQRLPNTIQSVIKKAGLHFGEIDHFLIHQANLNIVKEVFNTLGESMSKATNNVDRFGNTGAATVFTVLHEALARGRIKHGDRIIMAAIGAGFIWGSLCFRYSDESWKGDQ